MGVDEGNLQVMKNVGVILESYPITFVILNLLVYNSTIIQYSTILLIATVYNNLPGMIVSQCHRTTPPYLLLLLLNND